MGENTPHHVTLEVNSLSGIDHWGSWRSHSLKNSFIFSVFHHKIQFTPKQLDICCNMRLALQSQVYISVNNKILWKWQMKESWLQQHWSLVLEITLFFFAPLRSLFSLLLSSQVSIGFGDAKGNFDFYLLGWPWMIDFDQKPYYFQSCVMYQPRFSWWKYQIIWCCLGPLGNVNEFIQAVYKHCKKYTKSQFCKHN